MIEEKLCECGRSYLPSQGCLCKEEIHDHSDTGSKRGEEGLHKEGVPDQELGRSHKECEGVDKTPSSGKGQRNSPVHPDRRKESDNCEEDQVK